MDNRKLDKIALRMGLIFAAISVFCIVITSKPSAEFTISIVSLVASVAVVIAAAIRINKDKDE